MADATPPPCTAKEYKAWVKAGMPDEAPEAAEEVFDVLATEACADAEKRSC